MKTKPLDLRRLTERDLVSRLADDNNDLRWASFQELCSRAEKRGWEAYGLMTQDTELARLFVSPKDPFDAVGALVGLSTYDRIRTAWPDAVERKIENGGRELTIDFRHRRLDVVCLGETPWPVQGETPEGQEGLGEVEFCVTDVSAFSARVGQLKGDLRGRLILLPGSEGAALHTRFLLAHVPGPRGTRTVLVQLVQG
ncbi:MAG: hypothetical protein KBG07_05750 [Elusimicrobia bacterium]|nr:hypothetical protein [Elusimicrobiota bacterium]MBP9128257.1 hypothetical protein [Elusimicrobiota bacterium]